MPGDFQRLHELLLGRPDRSEGVTDDRCRCKNGLRILRSRCRMVCGPARGLESDHRGMAAFVNTISPRAEVSSRSDQASWNGSGTVARARGCRSQVAACAKAGPLVLYASRQTSVEEFAVSTRFPES